MFVGLRALKLLFLAMTPLPAFLAMVVYKTRGCGRWEPRHLVFWVAEHTGKLLVEVLATAANIYAQFNDNQDIPSESYMAYFLQWINISSFFCRPAIESFAAVICVNKFLTRVVIMASHCQISSGDFLLDGCCMETTPEQCAGALKCSSIHYTYTGVCGGALLLLTAWA